MSNKLAGFTPSTSALTPPVVALREVTNLLSVHSLAPTVAANAANDNDSSFSGILTGEFWEGYSQAQLSTIHLWM